MTLPLEIWTLTTHIPSKIAIYCDLFDEGNLPPDAQIEMAQLLIDCDLHNELLQYPQFCDYCIGEGLCYEVGIAEDK